MQKKILFWVAVGILIRLAFMPFSGHKDFLASYARSNQIVKNATNIFSYNQPLSHIVQAVNLKIFSPLLPEDKLPIYQEYHWPYEAAIPHFEIVHRAFFVFKLPYLFFELLALWLLVKIVKDKAQKISLVKIWMLNPLVIRSHYIFIIIRRNANPNLY